MDETHFQHELFELKRRLSALSANHTVASRPRPQDQFAIELADLKLCLATMQDRFHHLNVAMAQPCLSMQPTRPGHMSSPPSMSPRMFGIASSPESQTTTSSEYRNSVIETPTSTARDRASSDSDFADGLYEQKSVFTPRSTVASSTDQDKLELESWRYCPVCPEAKAYGAKSVTPIATSPSQSLAAQGTYPDGSSWDQATCFGQELAPMATAPNQLQQQSHLHVNYGQIDQQVFHDTWPDFNDLRERQFVTEKRLDSFEKDKLWLSSAVASILDSRYESVRARESSPRQLHDKSGPHNGREGVAFRDQEICRLDEQLRLAHDNLKASEEALADKTSLCKTLNSERNDAVAGQQSLEQRCWDLQERLVCYRKDSKDRDAEMTKLHDDIRYWKHCTTRAEDAWKQCSTQLRDSCRRFNARSDSHKNELREQKSRTEAEIHEITAEHKLEMRCLQNICEQKDNVERKQKYLLESAEDIIRERDNELDRLQRELALVEEDRGAALRTMRKTARLLDERDSDVDDRKRTPEAAVVDTASPAPSLSGSRCPRLDLNNLEDDVVSTRSRTPSPRYYPDQRRSERTMEARSPSLASGQDDQDSTKPPMSDQISFTSGTSDDRGRGCYERRWQRIGDATLHPPLPAPAPFMVRRMMSEANLGDRMPANPQTRRNGLAKHQSMQDLARRRLQPYVETEGESSDGGNIEFGDGKEHLV